VTDQHFALPTHIGQSITFSSHGKVLEVTFMRQLCWRLHILAATELARFTTDRERACQYIQHFLDTGTLS